MIKMEFRNCPFCGSSNVTAKKEVLERRMNGSEAPCSAVSRVWAQCEYCGATGSKKIGDIVYDTEVISLAMEGWNRRT